MTKVQFAQDSEGYLTLVAYPVQKKRALSAQRRQGYLDVEESSSGGDSPASGEDDDDDVDTTQSDSDSESPSLAAAIKERPRQR